MRKLLYSVALLLACCGFAARARAAVPRLSWVENDEQIRKVFEGEPLVRSMTMVDPPVAAGFPILPDSSTKVWAAATANELVVRFERRAPQSRPSAGEGSSTDWVGVLLDVENDDQSWYEIRLDMKGTLVESKRFSNGCAQMSWSCKPECRIDRKDGAWSATLRIPFKNLGARPATGDVWGFNFVHKKVVDAKTPPGTADVAKTYETNWTGSPYLDDSCEMLDPLCFRDIALGRAEKLVQVDSVSRGTVSSAESLSNVFRGRAKNNAASRISLRVAVIGPDGRTIASKKVYAPGKQEETFALPYPRVRGAGTVTFRIEGRGVDNPVYESKYAVASNPERRVFAVKEPAPGDLMQWRTFPLTVYGAPLWLADSPRRIAADAERLAIPWSKESFFAHLAENRLSPVLEPTSSGEKINELEQVAPLLRRTGLKGVIAHHGAMQLRDALDKQRGLYWGVVFQSPYRGVSERTAKGFDRRIVTIAGLENGRGEALSYSALKDRYDVAALLIRDRPVRAWSDPFGFFTKILADLSDIDEIWVGARGFHYCSVDEIRQLLSSAVRCGATGLVVSALEHGAGGRLGSEFWTAPERWKYLIELQQLFSRGLSAKRPEFADALVVLPTEELKPSSERRERFLEILEAAHVMIGPVAGVWYRFVGEDQIAEGFEKLDWHKVIFLPAWRCGNSKAREALRAYAKAGGTLVVTDPRAVWPGDDSEAARKAFLGQSELKSLKKVPGAPAIRSTAALGAEGKFKLDWAIEPGAGTGLHLIKGDSRTEAMLVYGGGDSAAVVRPLGKGRVCWFGFNPFGAETVRDEKWRAFWKKFTRYLGLKTERPVWRFLLPPPKSRQAVPRYHCLTNNHIWWRASRPLTFANRNKLGRYTYEQWPDKIRDEGGTAGWIPFSRGDLTDRLQGAKADGDPSKHVVSWTTTGQVAVVFDLRAERDLRGAKAFVTGYVPRAKLYVSGDGKSWRSVAYRAGGGRDGLIDFGYLSRAGRFVRIKFYERPKGTELRLVEVEIWGKD